jgi:hypothetical protein
MAVNALRHFDLCKPWPFKLLMPLDPISNILPAVISKDTDVRKTLLNETDNRLDSIQRRSQKCEFSFVRGRGQQCNFHKKLIELKKNSMEITLT